MKKLHIKKNRKRIRTVQFSVNNETLKYVDVPIQTFQELCKIFDKLQPVNDSSDDELSDEPMDSILSDLYSDIKGNPDYRESAVAVKSARLSENMSQKVLAYKLGIEQGNLSKIENAKRPVGKMLAKKLASVFNLSHKIFLSD